MVTADLTSAVAVALVALAVTGLLGWAVLAPLRPLQRAALLPAAPLLGVALLAVVLSTTSWWLSAAGGLAVTGVVAVALVVLGVVRGTAPWRTDPRAVAGALGLLALGAVGAAVAFLPNLWVGDARVIAANDSGDAYFYTAETSWLAERPFSPVPEPGDVPGTGNATPADVPLRAALAFPLRIGQPLVQAALAVASGQDAVRTVMVVTVLWVALVAPAAFVAGRLLRMGRGACVALAAVSSTSALLVQQVYQQNFDAVLGVSLALLATAAAVAAASRRIPLWPAALLLAGLAGVYTEYALYVAPAVVAGAVLVRPWRRAGRRTLRLLLVVGAAVLIAPTTWVRGVSTLLLRRDGDGFGSPLFSDGVFAAAGRVVGTVALAQPVGDPGSRAVLLTVVLAAALLAGWLLAVLLDRYRWMWATLLVVGLGYVAFLTSEHRGYTQLRAASLLLPLLLLASAAGWAALVRRLRAVARREAAPAARRVRRAAYGVVAAGLVAVVAVAVVVNVRAAPRGLDRGFAAARVVDDGYEQAARWVDEHGGADGVDVTVLAPDLHTQMWLAHALRHEPLVSYPALRPDYLGMTSYWAGERDPLMLLGPGASHDVDPAAVVASGERFTLVDLRRAPALVATPLDLPRWSARVQADGRMIGPDGGQVLVVRSPDVTGSVDVEVAVPATLEGATVAVTVEESGRVFRAAVTGGRTVVPVDLGDRSVATLTVDLGDDGPTSPEQFVLMGVTRAL